MNYTITNGTLRMVDDELYHYGVKGMRWGIRRDEKYLAARRRNIAVRRARDEYEMSDRSKSDVARRKQAIRKARSDYKSRMAEVDAILKKATDEKQLASMQKTVATKRVNDIPHSRVQRGLKLVNNLGTAAVIAGTAVSTAITLTTPIGAVFAGEFIASAAVNAAATAGAGWLVDHLLDKTL